MTSYTFKTNPYAIGFDSLFDEMSKLNQRNPTYPPYNIVKTDEHKYAIEVAVAGFEEAELDVTLHQGKLTISGEKAPMTVRDDEYLYKGIGTRDFKHTYTLANEVEVRDVSLRNGILSVHMENVIPEEKKPRKLKINSDKGKQFLSE